MNFLRAALLLYAALHAYLFFGLRRALDTGAWQYPLLVWLLLMTGAWAWRIRRRPGPVAEQAYNLSLLWLGFAVLLSYCFFFTDLLALLANGAAFLLPQEPFRRIAAFFSSPFPWRLALGCAVLLFCYALYEAQTPRVTTVPVKTSKLTGGERVLRVAGVSDIHISALIGRKTLRRMARHIAAQKPDILLICGDLVDRDLSLDYEEEAEILRSIPAPLGKYAVLGNHEGYRGVEMSVAFMEKSGMRVLRGQHEETGGIVIAGVDDRIFAGRFSPDTTNVERTLSRVPSGRFTILMNHQPVWPPSAVGRFDLQFSGHTHGGQFWPGGWLTRKIYGVRQGLSALTHEETSSLLFTGNGLGFWGPPIRFLAPPEIVLFLIHTPDAGAEASLSRRSAGGVFRLQ